MKIEIRNRETKERLTGRKFEATVKRMFGQIARPVDTEPVDGQIVTVVDNNNNVVGEIAYYEED